MAHVDGALEVTIQPRGPSGHLVRQLHFTGQKTEVQNGPGNAQVTRVSRSGARTRPGRQALSSPAPSHAWLA